MEKSPKIEDPTQKEGIELGFGRNLRGVKRIKFLRERRRGSAVKK